MKPRAAAARGGLRGERQRAYRPPIELQFFDEQIEPLGYVRASAKTLAIICKPARETKAKQQPQRRLTLTVELDRVSWKLSLIHISEPTRPY